MRPSCRCGARFSILAMLLLACAPTVRAGSAEGLAAFLRGDDAAAAREFREAAELGIAEAMHNLGVLHEFGRGIVRDLVRAHMWYNLAAAKGTDPEDRERSVRNRDRVAAQLTAGQLARAQALARDWRPGTGEPREPATAGTVPRVLPGRPSPNDVVTAQFWLQVLGHDPGPVDGTTGPRTAAAVRAFQRAQGLPVTGTIDAVLLEALQAAVRAGR